MSNEQARREMEALFPGYERNDTLRAAFMAHPAAANILKRQPQLGRRIPWVLVECDVSPRPLTGLIVDGTYGPGGWDAAEKMVLFTDDLTPGGAFVLLKKGSVRFEVIGTTPGSTRSPDRPHEVDLLLHLSVLTKAWNANEEATRLWRVWSSVNGQTPFPQCYLEIAFGGEVYRGLVVGGTLAPSGQWDLDKEIDLMIEPDDILAVDAARADRKEVLGGHYAQFPHS